MRCASARTTTTHPTLVIHAHRQENVEDTKGNNGEPGELTITNLRFTWVCRRNRRTNISVGLDCIVQISVKPAASRLKGGLLLKQAGAMLLVP